MAYVKAHPFGYKSGHRTAKSIGTPLYKKQTVTTVTSYKVMRRKMVWEVDPETGKRKMKLVPVYEREGKNRKPVYDTFKASQHFVLNNYYNRPQKGRTLAQMVYDTFPQQEK